MTDSSLFNKYYKLLGIPPTASTAQIRTAYRSLAHKHHADKPANKDNPKSDEIFSAIHEAYSNLADEGKKWYYDAIMCDVESEYKEIGFWKYENASVEVEDVFPPSEGATPAPAPAPAPAATTAPASAAAATPAPAPASTPAPNPPSPTPFAFYNGIPTFVEDDSILPPWLRQNPPRRVAPDATPGQPPFAPRPPRRRPRGPRGGAMAMSFDGVWHEWGDTLRPVPRRWGEE